MTRPTAIVIGTGVAGAATSFSLARRGVSVTLLEAGFPGAATAAGAGMIQPWSSARTGEFYSVYSAGADYYDDLIQQLAAVGVNKIGYRRTGAIVVNRDQGVLDEVENRLIVRSAAAQSMGIVSRVTNAAARELFPPLGPNFEALHIPGGAHVDGRALREGLLTASQLLGATVVRGTASLVPVGERGLAVRIGERTLEADITVIAAGAWTNRLLEPIGQRIPVEPQRGQVAHLRVAADTRSWPSVHPVSSHYIVAFDDSRVVIGATQEPDTGFDPRVTAAGQRQLLENALSVAPGLGDATIIETRVGLRPSPDGGMPLVGPLQGMDGVFLNAGFGAVGLTIGPVVGDLLAAIALGESASPEAGFLSNIDGFMKHPAPRNE